MLGFPLSNIGQEMNANDKHDLKLIIYRLDDLDKKMEDAHQKARADLKFIKNNLFDPEEGLWAETKENTRFRENTTKAFWFIVPASIATFVKLVWDYIKGTE